jgi:hypothetical protein
MYALIAAFTGFTLVPDTPAEVVVLGVLTAMAIIGKVMDLAADDGAKRGDSASIRYRQAWGLDHRDSGRPKNRIDQMRELYGDDFVDKVLKGKGD